MKPLDTYSVKEFAQLAGVTVRTLQFYDKENLLKPSMYTEANHRLYRREDLLRLQQVLTLKYMGFSLDEIRDVLANPYYDIKQSLQIQKEAIDQRIAQLQKVSQALENTLTTLSSLKPVELDVNTVCEMIHGIINAPKLQWVQRYYTPEQLQKLAETRQKMSPQEMVQSWRDWADLIAAFQNLRDQNRPIHDPAVQKLAVKMDALLYAFTQGDAGITESLKKMYTDLDSQPADQQPYDPALRHYMQEAHVYYLKQKGTN